MRLIIQAVVAMTIPLVALGLTFALAFYHGYAWHSRGALLFEIAVIKGLSLAVGVVLAIVAGISSFRPKARHAAITVSVGLLVAGLMPGVIHVRSSYYLKGMANRIQQLEIYASSIKQEAQENTLHPKLRGLNPAQFAYARVTSDGVKYVWGNRGSGAWGIEIAGRPKSQNALQVFEEMYVFFEFTY